MSTQKPEPFPPTFTVSAFGPIPIKVGPCPRGDDTDTANAMREALSALRKLDDERVSLSRNQSFTALGRKQKLETAVDTAVAKLSILFEMGRAELEEASAKEAKLYAVPSLATSDAPAAARDVEGRAWFRALSEAGQIDIANGAGQGQNYNFVAMILRSPVPYAPGVQDALDAGWRRQAAAKDPALATEINLHRQTAQWVDDVLGMLCIATKRETDAIGLSSEEVIVIDQRYGAGLARRFGIADRDLQNFEAQRRMRAAARAVA